MKRPLLLLLVIVSFSACFAQNSTEELKQKFFAVCRDVQSGRNRGVENDTSIYRQLFHRVLECDSILNIRPDDETTIVEKAIWENYLGCFLANYSSKNPYKISEITPGTPIDSSDISTWDGAYLNQQILHFFDRSLQSAQILQNIDILQYKDLLQSEYHYQYLPTLYNFLAYNYACRLANFNTWTAHPFVCRDTNYITTSENFIQYEIPCLDSSSTDFKFIRLCQNLEKENLADGYSDALIFWNLERLKFIDKKISSNDFNDLFINTLKQLEGRYPKSVARYDLCKEIANYYLKSSHKDSYDLARDYLIKANLYETAMSGRIEQTWREWYETPAFYVDYLSPSTQLSPLIMLFSRQADSVYICLKNQHYVYVSGEKFNAFRRKDIVFDTIVPVVRGSEYGIDTTLLLLPPLPEKSYALYVNEKPILAPDEKQHLFPIRYDNLSSSYFSINNTQIVQFSSYDRAMLIAADGRDGSPLSSHGFHLMRLNSWRSPFYSTYIKSFCSKKDGRASTKISPYHSYNIVSKGYEDERILNYSFRSRQRYITTINLDRRIYRPGQVVYYKAILEKINSKKYKFLFYNKKPVIVSFAQNETCFFRDTLCPNEFSSIADSCVLPESVQPGMFTIQIHKLCHKKSINTTKTQLAKDSRNLYHRRKGRRSYWKNYYRTFMGETGAFIEEYKRPQFEISLDKPADKFVLGEKICVPGHLEAYAGYALNETEIKYSVVGKNYVADVGTLTSDADGNFEICFPTSLTPDSDVEEFTVEVSAVDVTGETQQKSISFQATAQPYKFNVELPSIYFEEETSVREIPVNVVNYAEKEQNVTVHFSIDKLIVPQQFKHKTPLASAHLKVQSDERFAPWGFNGENEPSSWPVERRIEEGDLDIAGAATISLPSLPSGTYRFTIKSKYSDYKEVVYSDCFSVGHLEDTVSPKYDGVWACVDKWEASAGDTLHFHIGTSIPNATIYVDLFNGRKRIKGFNIVNSQHYAFDYVVTSDDTIRVQLLAHCIHLGNVYSSSVEAQLRVLPKITYEWETFRSDLLPGEQTTFRLRFTNSDGTPTDAEVLCLMYDASLDVFAPNSIFVLPQFPLSFYPKSYVNLPHFSTTQHYHYAARFFPYCYRSSSHLLIVPDWKCGVSLRLNGTYGVASRRFNEESPSLAAVRGARSDGQKTMIDGVIVRKSVGDKLCETEGVTSLDGEISTVRGNRFSDAAPQSDVVTPRTNFSETAFFYPFLKTDENGIVEIKFTAPESLTRWKIQGVAHTKKRTTCLFSDTVRTKKPLMAVSNLPRFAYEGDTLLFSAKVVNTNAGPQQGTAELGVTDIDGTAITTDMQHFSMDSMGQYLFQCYVVVPAGSSALTFRFAAHSEGDNVKYSDGEQRTIPVLTRRMLVYESAPFFNTKKGNKTFVFSNLPKQDSDLESYRLVFTPQPAWNAVTALPLLIHPEYESTDQLCNQLLSSAMLLTIAQNTDLRGWLNVEVDSVRQKEIEARKQLWSVNPWLTPARTVEDENMQLAMLMEEDNLQKTFASSRRKLVAAQNPDGGWPWFKGGSSNLSITRRILIEIGRAREMGWGSELNISTYKALKWDADAIKENYEYLKVKYPNRLIGNCLNFSILQYLFARSYYLNDRHFNTEADQFYLRKLSTYAEDFATWSEQAMAALTLFAVGDTARAQLLMEEIKGAAQHSEELGMYWKEAPRRYFFSSYFSPIERQTLMIEAFEKILKDEESVREMKLWLLQQKRGQYWEAASVTANACMVLLTDYQHVENENADTIGLQVGNFTISVVDTLQMPIWYDMMAENIEGDNVTLSQQTDGFSFGTLMWQKWQDLDSIVAEGNARPLSVERQLWRVVTDDRGDVFQPISGETVLHPGERVRVQLIVTADRDLEYVWLKDLHSAAFDANDLGSGFRYEGVRHYRTVRDESVNYFFEEFPKGKHTFEYTMSVTQNGTFSDGYAEVKCIYNPEFAGHSASKGKVKCGK